MARLLEKSMLFGLGVLTLTRDRVIQAVNSLVEEGEVQADEASSIVDRLVARGEEERQELRKLVRQELDKMRVRAPLASSQDIEELSHKIDALAARVEELVGGKSD